MLEGPMVRRAALFAASALVLPPLPALAQQAPDLYARVNAQVAAHPDAGAKLGKPAPEMAPLDWLVGEWNIEALVSVVPNRPPEQGTSVVTALYGGVWLEIRDTYAAGTQDVGYVGYSVMGPGWTAVSIDNLGNANLAASAKGWEGDHIVFEGDFLILGVKAHLRQTVTKVSADEYGLVNDERLPDGTWKQLDSYRYTRRKSP